MEFLRASNTSVRIVSEFPHSESFRRVDSPYPPPTSPESGRVSEIHEAVWEKSCDVGVHPVEVGASAFDAPITPPLRGSRRSRAVRRRLMRWGASRRAPKRRLLRRGANQRLVHRLQHIHAVLEHLVVPKAQYSVPLPPQVIIVLLVVDVLFRMLTAVQFDHQFSGHAGKIYDIGTYRLLTPELVTVQLFVAQVVP